MSSDGCVRLIHVMLSGPCCFQWIVLETRKRAKALPPDHDCERELWECVHREYTSSQNNEYGVNQFPHLFPRLRPDVLVNRSVGMLRTTWTQILRDYQRVVQRALRPVRSDVVWYLVQMLKEKQPHLQDHVLASACATEDEDETTIATVTHSASRITPPQARATATRATLPTTGTTLAGTNRSKVRLGTGTGIRSSKEQFAARVPHPTILRDPANVSVACTTIARSLSKSPPPVAAAKATTRTNQASPEARSSPVVVLKRHQGGVHSTASKFAKTAESPSLADSRTRTETTSGLLAVAATTPDKQWQLIERRLAKVTESIERCRTDAGADAVDNEDDDDFQFYLDMKRKLLNKLRLVVEEAPKKYDVLDQLLCSVTQSISRVRKALGSGNASSNAELQSDFKLCSDLKRSLREDLQDLVEFR